MGAMQQSKKHVPENVPGRFPLAIIPTSKCSITRRLLDKETAGQDASMCYFRLKMATEKARVEPGNYGSSLAETEDVEAGIRFWMDEG